MKGKKFFPTMKQVLTIRDVKQLSKNSDFNVIGIASRLTRRLDRNDNPFWDVSITDAGGDLDGKVWSGTIWWNQQGGERFPIDPDNCGFKIEGMTLGVIGRVGDFKDQLQYTFTELFILDQEKYPPENYTKRSPVKPEILEEHFKNLIAGISYGPLKNFMDAVFFKHGLWEKYHIWPAAVTLHHAYTSGLLEHSVSVALGALGMAKHYGDFKIPVNLDLITAGALLHDIGKIKAYSNSPAPKVLAPGNIIEHVTLGYGMFQKFAELENLEQDLNFAISHIILSHHGRREYGSPVLPETPEAMIVSAADDIDFKLSYWKMQFESLSPDVEITEFLPLIERRFWRGIPQK